MKVRVYRCLQRQCWSLVNSKGRVFEHRDSLTLVACKMVVRPAGRARVLWEKRRGVHAFVVGELTDETVPASLTGISYNPFRRDCFTQRVNGAAGPLRGRR